VGTGCHVTGGFSDRIPNHELENAPMSTTPSTSLEEARARIDEIDRRIVELLAERYAVVDALCETKAENGDTVKDEDREQALLDHVAAIAEKHDLSPDLARRLYDEILDHSVQRQRRRREDEETASRSVRTTCEAPQP
jgi:chorismate mutase